MVGHFIEQMVWTGRATKLPNINAVSILFRIVEFLSKKTAVIDHCNWKTQHPHRHPAGERVAVGHVSPFFARAMARPVTDPPRQDKKSAPQPSTTDYNWSGSREISKYPH